MKNDNVSRPKGDKKYSRNRDSQPVVQANPYHDRATNEKDSEDLESDKWCPTEAAFQAFLDRDFALAQNNVAMLMLSTGRPMSIKEVKDNCLHNVETIERVLTSKVASGLLTESNGKYELAR